MAEPIRILLVDDHPVVLSGLSALLAGEEWAQVVGAVPTAAAALCRRLLAARADLLVLVMHADDESVRAALTAGASGCLLKDADPDELPAALRSTARGGLVVTAGASRALARPRAEQLGVLSGLTERERDVLELLAAGLPTHTIAAQLHPAPKTVRNRLSEVFVKLGVSGRGEAIALARDAGLGRRGIGAR